MLEKGLELIEHEIKSTDFDDLIENEEKSFDGSSSSLKMITSFTGYAIGIIFLLGCAQVVFLKHQLKLKKII